jgi:hypothetical protein
MGKIIWLASYPRSGNTWTRAVLHNLLAGLRGEATPLEINALHRSTTWEALPGWWQGLLRQPLERCTKAEVAAVRMQAQQRFADQATGLALVKTHHAFARSQGHPTINMKATAGAIYLLRNPLDLAVSLAAHLNYPLDRAIAELNQDGYETVNQQGGAYEHYGSWRRHVDSWTSVPSPRLLVLRYEDLLADPLTGFGKLAAHIGLQPPATLLSGAIAGADFKRLQAQELVGGFIERPISSRVFFRAGRAEQWRDTLTPAQVRAVVEPNRAVMARFGYLPEDA